MLGLAFKPLTDDIREAPSLRLIEELLKEGSAVRLDDPEAMSNMQAVFPEEPGRVEYCGSAFEVAQRAHAILLVTEWDEFRSLDWAKLREAMEVPVVTGAISSMRPPCAKQASSTSRWGVKLGCRSRRRLDDVP